MTEYSCKLPQLHALTNVEFIILWLASITTISMLSVPMPVDITETFIPSMKPV